MDVSSSRRQLEGGVPPLPESDSTSDDVAHCVWHHWSQSAIPPSLHGTSSRVFLFNCCDIFVLPIISNYVGESFTNYPSEANTIMSFYRLILGLFVPFFIDGWEARVGAGWVFGMMAFFAVFAFSFTAILAWKGATIRNTLSRL